MNCDEYNEYSVLCLSCDYPSNIKCCKEVEVKEQPVEEYQILREIRHKENRTQSENMLLKYHGILGTISEFLVSESKMHIDSQEAIDKIRDCMRKYI